MQPNRCVGAAPVSGLTGNFLNAALVYIPEDDRRGFVMSFVGVASRTAALCAVLVLGADAALAAPLGFAEPMRFPGAAPVDPLEAGRDVADASVGIAAPLRRQVVRYATAEAPGTIVIDPAYTYLYFVLGGGSAIRYGIGVGREGFTWSGTETIARKAEWPDWYPPSEMIQRQPYLPRAMAGGPGNPLGARALYLGNTEYRIHGTNQPATIGQHVSSGCIRMLNADVIDLFDRVSLGAKVVVLGPVQHRDQAARMHARSDTLASITKPAGVATIRSSRPTVVAIH
jgi:lipoprotein-anchoring transpeptidase ErfK/SrfK